MSVSIEIKNSGGPSMEEFLKKFKGRAVSAINTAMVQSGLELQAYTVREFLSISDGSKDDRRTTPEGLRRVTGETARQVRVGYRSSLGVFRVLNSANEAARDRAPMKSVHVGVSQPDYAVFQEEGGRARRPGKYAFLQPAARDFGPKVEEIISKVFDSRMKRP